MTIARLVVLLNGNAVSETSKQPDWRNNGVRVVHGGQLDPNTP